MNRDDIIRIAKEAGFARTKMHKALEKFAELIAAVEREACAKLCDQYETGSPEYYAETLARAIRARSQ